MPLGHAGIPSLQELLRDQKLLTERGLINALRQQLVLGGRLGTNLVELGYVRLDDIGRMLSVQLGVPHAGTRELRAASQGALVRVDPGFCFEQQVLPLGREGDLLHLAMCDPSPERVMEISSRLGCKIAPYITPELRLFFYLEQYHGLERPKRFLRVPDGGESFSRRRHYLLPTIDPMMANVLSGAPYEEEFLHSPFDNEEILILPEPLEHDPSRSEPEEAVSLSLFTQGGRSSQTREEVPALPEIHTVSVREVVQQLDSARSSGEISSLLVKPLFPQSATSILFWVRGFYAITCQTQTAADATRRPRSEPVVSLESPSILELAFRMRDLFRTEGTEDTLQQLIADYLGLPSPGEVCVAPVFLFGRTVYLLCVHSWPGSHLPDHALTDLRILSSKATVALERLCSRLTV